MELTNDRYEWMKEGVQRHLLAAIKTRGTMLISSCKSMCYYFLIKSGYWLVDHTTPTYLHYLQLTKDAEMPIR